MSERISQSFAVDVDAPSVMASSPVAIGASVKRKRPSPILTAMQPTTDAQADPLQLDDIPAHSTMADNPTISLAPGHVPSLESTSDPAVERHSKLLRVHPTNSDVSSGSPNLARSHDDAHPAAMQSHHQSHHTGATPRSSPPDFHGSTAASTPPATMVPAATPAVVPLPSSSAQTSAASSAFSTPLNSHPASALGSPSWSGLDDGGAADASMAPNTPPSNVASPSASPKISPAYENALASGVIQYPQLTVNTSISYLASTPTAGGVADQQRLSPSSSPAHSPTSTASQLRPVPHMSLITLSPHGSVAVGLSPRLSPSSRHMALSPRCPQHARTGAVSPARNPSSGSGSVASASSPRLSVPGGRSPSPGRSPAHTPWKKPQFLNKLHVSIPELSPLISSPVACGNTPVPRPSMAQVQKDRDRDEKQGRNSAADGTAAASSALTCPVALADGVVSSGAHYSISLLKGRRRNMEDASIQATIDLSGGSACGSDPASATHSPPPCNLFGIADGHGKNGALVAQLTAQLLPSILLQQLAQHTSLVAAADSVEPLPESDRCILSPLRTSTSAAAMSGVSVFSILQSPVPSNALQNQHATALVESAAAIPTPPTLTLDPTDSVPASSPPASSTSHAFSKTSASMVGTGMSVADSMSAAAADEFHLDDAPTDPISIALQEAYMQTDQRIIAGKYTGGTTCTTALIQSHDPHTVSPGVDGGVSTAAAASSSATLWVANVGDSRCVLSRSGRAIALTSDHKPDRADERARVEKAGGQVVYVSGWRVDGILNISRAIGDAHLKDHAHPHRGRVIARPEITVHQVAQEDEFIILASDGVWGRVDSQTAVDLVRRVLLEGDATTPDEAIGETLIPEDGINVDGTDAMIGLPRIPSLTHEHSYIHTADDQRPPRPMNPVQTPKSAAVPAASSSLTPATEGVPTYGRMGSTETVRSISTPRPGYAGLNSDGTMSTTMSRLTTLTPLISPNQPVQADTPFTSPTGRTFASHVSSTQLTTPIGGMTMGQTVPATAATAPCTMKEVTTDVQVDATAVGDVAIGGVPCCWSSLAHRSHLIAAASEALIRHAYEEANSMDNISVCVVLLYPFQRTNDEQHEHQHQRATQSLSH
jgi:serine/threonine protein phosphatase PrpC